MARTESTITSQGLVSIPSRIREKLGLVPGSKVQWCEEGDDVVVRRVSKKSSKTIYEALFPVPPQPHSVDEMDAGIAAHLWQKCPRR